MGGQYAWVGIEETLDTLDDAGTAAFAKQVSHFWGIGPEIGLDFGFCFFNCFSFVCRGTGSLLVTRILADYSVINGAAAGGNGTSSDRLWRVVPAWDLRFGISYDIPICQIRHLMYLHLEAGYEVLTYSRGLRALDQFTPANTAIFQYSNADMNGFYLNIGIAY